MRGQQPKPIERHRAEGTWNATRHAPTPTLAGGRGVSTRRGTARTPAGTYRELTRSLADSGILDTADGPMIEAAAIALARARAAGADVAGRGVLIEVRRVGRDGSELVRLEANPALDVERKAWTEFRHLADRIGIGPVARARLAGLGVQGRSAEEEFDELADLRAARTGTSG